jgi:hypothetical protein
MYTCKNDGSRRFHSDRITKRAKDGGMQNSHLPCAPFRGLAFDPLDLSRGWYPQIRDVDFVLRLDNACELSPGYYRFVAPEGYASPAVQAGRARYGHAFDPLPEDRAGNLYRHTS